MADTIKITTLAQLKATLEAVKVYVDGQINNLGPMAKKSDVSYNDLTSDLKTLIDAKASKTTVDSLVGSDAGKSVRTISSEEVAKIVAGADKSYDTLKEIADWILGDTTGSAKMTNDITRLDTILNGIGGANEEATVVAYVTKMVNSLNIGDHIEKIKVNGTEVVPNPGDKAVSLTIPTGKLASKDIVTEIDLDDTLKAKVNAASSGNHSHANKAFLDTLYGATNEEVTAMCAAVFNS